MTLHAAVVLLAAAPADRSFVEQYCVACHNTQIKTADLALDRALEDGVVETSDTWEEVVRRLRARQMPPAGMPRPEESEYETALASLEEQLDGAARANPNPGRTDTFRRLNRTEYRNAIRDLLALDVDVSELLPKDELSLGFDNITVADLSPTLLDRYVSAAEKISRLAVGRAGRTPDGRTVRLPPDLTQEEHIDGLPLGTRGGAVIRHTFPVDGEYEIKVRLARDRNEHVEGFREPQEVELLLDRKLLQTFPMLPPRTPGEHANADEHLRVRLAVKAGPHDVGATFRKKPSSLLETARQPYEAQFNFYRHPRTQPAIYSVSITGPFTHTGVSETPSRERIFSCRPTSEVQQDACAERILLRLARLAFRRPVESRDIAKPLALFREARDAEDDFEAGIEMGLAAILVSPEFLFRVERDPPDCEPGEAYEISDLELATRLSFFLWSSIPDDALLRSAEKGDLRDPEIFDGHIRRMLADERSRSLVDNFAAQWLHLRNLQSIRPDMRLFPDFDDNLRQAMRRETEMLVETVIREDRSVLDLLSSDYTFVNERLAKHYGIPNIYGDRFRRVDLPGGSRRGGLLRHGSVLTVTSYATRTSPVIRGKWVLENILGIPPPPPPPNVPTLEENEAARNAKTLRERLAAHRDNAACRGCHQLMDPVGFALENYDAVGRWRTEDGGHPIDSSGGLPDGSTIEDAAGLERALLRRPDVFAGALAEKLLTFGLGRGVEAYDGPAIRQAVRDAAEDDFRFSALVGGIARSVPFQMRRPR